jgi:membrane protease YdiL (CAAX protease family)
MTPEPTESLQPPQTSPSTASPSRFLLAVIVMIGGFGAFASGGAVAQLFSVPFGLWWTEIFVFFGVAYVALRLSGRDPLPAAGLRKPWVAGCAFGFTLGVTNFFACAAPLMFLSTKLAPKEVLDLYDAAAVFRDRSTLEIIFIVAGVVIAAPLGEEFFFRGVVMPGLSQRMSVVLAAVSSGWIFSAFHLDLVGFLARWELGIIFGLLAWRTGSLWPGIFAHAGNNLISTVLYFSSKGEIDDTPDVKSLAPIVGLGGLAMLFVLVAAWKIPSVLNAPERAEEKPVVARPSLVAKWITVAVASIALLLAIDFRGSLVRAIDGIVPVKEPTEELRLARRLAVEKKIELGEYWKARQSARKR